MDDFLLRDVLPRHRLDALPETKNGDAVRDLEDVVEIVRHDHNAEPAVGEAANEVEHLPRLRDAQSRRRLVQDHDPGVPHDRLGDGDRLALAAREARHGLTDRAERRDREAVQGLPRRLLHPGLIEDDAVDPLAPEKHVRHDVEVVCEREVLVDDLDSERRGIPGPGDRHSLAFEVDLALVERVDPGDALDQRGLAGAVVPDEGHDLSGRDLEVDLVERLHRAELLRDVGAVQNRRGARRRPFRRRSRRVLSRFPRHCSSRPPRSRVGAPAGAPTPSLEPPG